MITIGELGEEGLLEPPPGKPPTKRRRPFPEAGLAGEAAPGELIEGEAGLLEG